MTLIGYFCSLCVVYLHFIHWLFLLTLLLTLLLWFLWQNIIEYNIKTFLKIKMAGSSQYGASLTSCRTELHNWNLIVAYTYFVHANLATAKELIFQVVWKARTCLSDGVSKSCLKFVGRNQHLELCTRRDWKPVQFQISELHARQTVWAQHMAQVLALLLNVFQRKSPCKAYSTSLN